MSERIDNQGLDFLSTKLVLLHTKMTRKEAPRPGAFVHSAAAAALGLFVVAAPGCARHGESADAPTSTASALPAKLTAVAETDAIRPFRINFSDEALVDRRAHV